MFTLRFWRDALERAVATCAQTFVALFVLGAGDVVPAFNQLTHAAIAAGVAAGLSIVKALAGSQVGDGSASLLPPVVNMPPAIDTVPVDLQTQLNPAPATAARATKRQT